MITVTQIQQEALAAELAKRAKASPAIPKPTPEAISWAKSKLGSGYQSSTADRLAAQRVLQAAGVDPAPFDAADHGDDAPPGARDVAAAVLAREQAAQAEAAADVPKSYYERGISAGPGRPMMPGHMDPAAVDRGYIDAGHAAESPQAEAARQNPAPPVTPGQVTPVALPQAGVGVQHVNLPGVMAGYVPPAVSASLSLGSPSDR